jgi:hypothetical protein
LPTRIAAAAARMTSAVHVLIALAGCPGPGGASQLAVPPSAGAGVGCPAAASVYVASYLTPVERAADPAHGHSGWVLPLHDAQVATLANQPEYATIDAASAAAAGVPTAPTTVWLLTPGQPPCRATAGAYYAAAVDATPPNVAYGVELSGCAAPPADQQQDAAAIALVSESPPTGCQLVTPRPVAARLGEVDAQQRWQRPSRQTPIPPALAAALPPRDCRAPDCEALWAIAQVDVAGRPVAWAGAVNWLTIPANAAPASQCDWKVDSFAGFFVAGRDGRATKVTEGQDHPLLLTGVLADASGARALVAQGAGEYAIYDLAGGAATLARHLVWLRLSEDAYALDERLGPSCGR